LPTRKPKPFAITIDTREQTPWTFGDDAVITRATMPSGDYAPTGHETEFAIERKALGDLVACCTWERDRFLRELERLQAYAFKCMIVEASLDDVAQRRYRANVVPAAVVGSVVAFHVDFGVPAIWGGTPAAAARIAERMMRRFVAKRSAAAEGA
jgi:ERCC4-type nuclease